MEFTFVDKDCTWGSFAKLVCELSRERIADELLSVEALIDSGIMDDSLFFDYVCGYCEILRSECIRRYTNFKVGA